MKKVARLKDAAPDLMRVAEELNLPMMNEAVMEEYLRRRNMYDKISTLDILSKFITNCLKVGLDPIKDAVEIMEFHEWEIPEDGDKREFLCTDGKMAIIIDEGPTPRVVPLNIL